MTKKDYEGIANAVRECTGAGGKIDRDELIERLCDAFRERNSGFYPKAFHQTAGYKELARGHRESHPWGWEGGEDDW